MLQGIDSIAKFLNFNGNAEDLIAASARLANELRLLPDGEHTPRADEISSLAPPEESEPQDTGNERLLRHYVSMKVVDRPTRQGRDAIYGYRHLLQFLTARRLLLRGFGLAKIAQYTSVVPTQSLADALISPPHRSEAELLVTAYKTSDPRVSGEIDYENKPILAAGKKPRPAAIPRQAPQRPPPVAPGALHGMADLLHEVDKMRHRFADEMMRMQRDFQSSIGDLHKALELARLGNDAIGLQSSLPLEKQHAQLMDGLSALTAHIQSTIHKTNEDIATRVDLMEQRLLMETESNRKQIDALTHAMEFHTAQLEIYASKTIAQSRTGDSS